MLINRAVRPSTERTSPGYNKYAALYVALRETLQHGDAVSVTFQTMEDLLRAKNPARRFADRLHARLLTQRDGLVLRLWLVPRNSTTPAA